MNIFSSGEERREKQRGKKKERPANNKS